MKTLFTKSSSLLKYYLTFMGTAILLGLIFLFTFGFNTSGEFGKLYEVRVYSFDSAKNQTYIETVEDVLDIYGYSPKDVLIEEHTDSDAVVLRYRSTSENNAIKIEADVTERLELNENLVEVQALTSSSATKDSLKLLIGLGVIAVVLFIYALLRHDWKFAVTLVSTLVLSVILPLAIMLFTRIELSLTTLGVLVLFSALTTILYMALYAKVKSIEKSQRQTKRFLTNTADYMNAVKFKAIIPTAIVLLVFVCLIFTFVRSLVHVGLVGLVLMVVDAFLLVIFAPTLQILLQKEKN